MSTQTEAITHAMRLSGLLGDDESPTAEQFALSETIYNSRVIGLQVRGVNLWGWTEANVPDEWIDPLGFYVSLFLRAAGGGPPPTTEQILAAEYPIRALAATEPTGDIIAADHF